MALPLAAPPQPSAAAPFERRFARLCRRYRRLWRETGDATPEVGPLHGRRRQWRNARATRSLIDRLAEEIRCYPEAEPARRVWRDRLRETVSRFGEERFGWPAGYRDLLFADDFFDTTVAFSREARAFDREVRAEALMQALRNVWIMNSIQMLLDLEVRFTPAVFAYSMLYPATDNVLDDPRLPPVAKRALNRRLGRRLAGDRPPPADRRQKRIWSLLDRIEEQYPRSAHPEVWSSLRAIHHAQVESLRQQTEDLGGAELLAISVAKGGASVLADGWLAAGALAPDETDFCFGYGVFLQLLDDLQDARVDREAGHATLFASARPPIDRLASRLDAFMGRVVEASVRFRDPRYAARRDLILRNCRTLLVGAIAEQPELFSRRFRRAIETRWPLRFRALRRLRRYGDRRLRQVAGELRDSRGVDSLFDLLG